MSLQIQVAVGKRVRVDFTPEMRAASGKKLAYPTRAGYLTGAMAYHAMAEVNFGPDPRSQNNREVREFVPREALVLA